MSITFVATFQASEQTVRRADFREYKPDGACAQSCPVRLETVAPASLNDFPLMRGSASLASYFRNGLH